MTSLSEFRAISLSKLTSQGELLRRYDTKYLLHLHQLPEIYTQLSSQMSILDQNGVRCSPYATTYFDTKDLRTYHDHLKRRRKRFKIRTRFYDTPERGYLEIKIKKPRGQTLKVRWEQNLVPQTKELSAVQLQLVNSALRDAFYEEIREPYFSTLQTTFNRTTLFDELSRERLTIDTQLNATLISESTSSMNSDNRSINLGEHCAIIEIKSPTKVGPTHRLFTQLGIRPSSVSKYCVSMTALHPMLNGAPWREPLRVLQGAR